MSVTIRDGWRPPLGSSKARPRHGTAYVHKTRASRARASASGQGVAALAARTHHVDIRRGQLLLDLPALRCVPKLPRWVENLALAVGGDAYVRVPLWSGAQHWARITVPVAYDLRYKSIRGELEHDRVSRKTLLKVADARARFADGRTGRHCRPTNETLAACTGLPERTVQRATRLLALLGCATEILRGRLRTKAERLASWRLGDRSRGWASVWSLHAPRPLVDNSRDRKGLWRPCSQKMSPHPRRGSVSVEKGSLSSYSPTDRQAVGAGHGPPMNGGAARHSSKQGTGRPRQRAFDPGGRLLALRWLAEGATPAWAGRHSPRGWATALAAPAAHGWTPDDLNTVIREWGTVGANYLPAEPHKPIGLLYTILAWHGDLVNRPAAAAAAQIAAVHAADLAAMDVRRQAAAAAQPACAEHRAVLRAQFAADQRRRKGQAHHDG